MWDVVEMRGTKLIVCVSVCCNFPLIFIVVKTNVDDAICLTQYYDWIQYCDWWLTQQYTFSEKYIQYKEALLKIQKQKIKR